MHSSTWHKADLLHLLGSNPALHSGTILNNEITSKKCKYTKPNMTLQKGCFFALRVNTADPVGNVLTDNSDVLLLCAHRRIATRALSIELGSANKF